MNSNVTVILKNEAISVGLRRSDGHQWILISDDTHRTTIAVHGTSIELAEFAASIRQAAIDAIEPAPTVGEVDE